MWHQIRNYFQTHSKRHLIKRWCQVFLFLGCGGVLFSVLFPRNWIWMDGIRLYFQKNIITVISEREYRQKIGNPVILSDLAISRLLAPWDLVFSSENSSLGSVFIDGKRKHVFMYLGTPRQLRLLLGKESALYQAVQDFAPNQALIIESRFDGVKIKPLQDLPATEALVALRVELPKHQMKSWIELLAEHLDKPYDFDFDSLNHDELYCSELLAPSLEAWGFRVESESTMLRSVISPTALLTSLFEKKKPARLVHMLFYLESQDGVHYYHSREELLKALPAKGNVIAPL